MDIDPGLLQACLPDRRGMVDHAVRHIGEVAANEDAILERRFTHGSTVHFSARGQEHAVPYDQVTIAIADPRHVITGMTIKHAPQKLDALHIAPIA